MPIYVNGVEVGNLSEYAYPLGWKSSTGDTNHDQLLETIKTIQTLCEVCLRLGELPCTGHLLPSLLELIHIESQNLIDEHCIE